MTYKFSQEFETAAERINMSRMKTADPNFELGTKEEFLKLLEEKLIQ
jgi:hypothetical protein